jgi:hypothetical protein
MFNTNGGYSLSDIAAVSGNNGRNNGAFGDDWAWIIILLLCGWGNGGFGFGGGRGEGTTREEISYGFDMNGLENGIRGIQQGLCDGFYAMNTSMLNGFAGVNNAITQSTIADMQSDFGLQTAINNSTNAIANQLNNMAAANAACCCDTRAAIKDGFCELNYNLATQSCETRRAIIDNTREIIDFLTQDKIATLTAENQNLKFAASQAAQNAYLINELSEKCPVPAYVVPNPNVYATPVYYGCGGNLA